MTTEKLSMIGHIKDTPRVLKKAYDIRSEYMSDFLRAFTEHDFKKVYFLGSGTSHHAALVIRNIFVELLRVEGVACEPTIFTYHEHTNRAAFLKKKRFALSASHSTATASPPAKQLKQRRNKAISLSV